MLVAALSGCGYTTPQATIDAVEVADVPVDDSRGRVTAGLIGIWEFDDMGGSNMLTITEGTSLTPEVTPAIQPGGNVQWLPTSLKVTSPTKIFSTPGRLRLVDNAVAMGGVTLEAWVSAENATQTGTNGQPTRVVSIAPSNGNNHHISINQDSTSWLGQAKTLNANDPHGLPALVAPVEVGQSTHLVVTVDATSRKFYAHGLLVQEDALGGVLNWDPNGRTLSLAGEPNGLNAWSGTFHLVAMYDRALTADDVLRNKNAGP